jgi:lipopolysaccharide export system permease protein
MKMTLDRYVTRAVFGSCAAAMTFFLLLSVLLDLLNNLGEYIERSERKGQSTLELLGFLANYYARMMPFSFVALAPFAIVIGCMLAVSRLMTQNEVQPMLFMGRSMPRVLRPALLAGVVTGFAMVACFQWVVPYVASQITEVQSLLASGDRSIKNVVLEARRESGFTALRVHRYDPELRQMDGIHLLREGVLPGDARLIRAERATWDDNLLDWRLQHGLLETRDLADKPVEILGVPEWTPEMVRQRGQDSVDCELLSYGELVETRRARPNRTDVAMVLHRHITYPFANLILLLLALPFVIHFERGTRVDRILGAIAVCVAYLVFDLMCQNLGQAGYLRPVVAAWSPTILFGSLGIVMFGSIRT